MDTQSLNQAINQAQQANNINEWVLFTFVVIAPLALIIIIIPAAIIGQRKFKCGKCGNWRKNKIRGRQIVKTVEGNKTIITKQRVIVCRKCGNQFTV